MSLLRSISKAAAIAIPLGLAGCAFQPLYGDRTGPDELTENSLSQVEVQLPSSRLGQIIRNELIFAFKNNEAGSLYDLDVSPSASQSTLFSNTVGRVTSYSYIINATWQLESKATGQVLTTGRSQAGASYNRTDQPCANIRAERDAEERAAKLIAEDITTRVAAYFATQQGQ